MTSFLAAVGRYTRFTLAAVWALPRLDRAEMMHQAYLMGVGSILVILAVCAFAGAMLAVQGFASLKAFGTPELLGMFISLAGVREVFPLVGAGCAGAKLGSAVAAEVATLRIGQQIDALEVMSVDPMRYLVAPRMVACLVVTPLLVGAGLLAGLGAAYLTATLQLGVDPGSFITRALENISVTDLLAALVKGLAFGALTGSMACWQGFDAAGGPASVGTAANMAVVRSMMVGAVVNLFISQAFYGGLL
ncbi:MAG: ABC transporter permease [Myxococcota bacterium]